MRITKRQLRRTIREERARILSEQAPSGAGIFNSDYIHDLLLEEIKNYSDETGQVTEDEWQSIREAVDKALDKLEGSVINQGGIGGVPPRTHRTPTEEESGIPDSQRSVIHNRRPNW